MYEDILRHITIDTRLQSYDLMVIDHNMPCMTVNMRYRLIINNLSSTNLDH